MYPEELPNGKYKWTLDFKDPLTNKRKRISITLDSKSKKAEKQARAILEARKEEILSENKESKDLTFHEFYQEFFNDWSKNVKGSTIRVWKYDMKQFLNSVPKDALLIKINRRFLQSIFDKMEKDGASSKSLNRVLIRVKQIFRKAVEYEYIDKNPATYVAVKKIEKKTKPDKVQYLEKDTVIAIAKELKRIDQTAIANIIMLLYLTGMRAGEALALTVDDIDFELHTISISKTWSEMTHTINKPKTEKSNRTIHTSKTIEQIIKNQISQSGEEGGTVFLSNRGCQIRVFEVNRHLKIACQNLNIPPVTSHVFRHSHISMLAELGIPIKAIMDRVGHSDSATTLKVYSHVTEKMTNKLVNQVENGYATFMPLN